MILLTSKRSKSPIRKMPLAFLFATGIAVQDVVHRGTADLELLGDLALAEALRLRRFHLIGRGPDRWLAAYMKDGLGNGASRGGPIVTLTLSRLPFAFHRTSITELSARIEPSAAK
jgi:hypothetical protein